MGNQSNRWTYCEGWWLQEEIVVAEVYGLGGDDAELAQARYRQVSLSPLSYERGIPVAQYISRNRDLVDPLSSQYGTQLIVKARFRPWLSGLSFLFRANNL